MPSPKMQQTALDGDKPLPNGKQWVAGYWRSDPRWTVKATTPTRKTESSPATAAQRKKKETFHSPWAIKEEDQTGGRACAQALQLGPT